MKKPLYDVGINDADYSINPRINGKQQMCPYYCAWQNMLRRCYSSKFKILNQTYIGCIVCEEWHSFMAFRAWMIQQDWQGKQLDKDLLVSGNKIYSPDTCIFVPQAINNILSDRGAARGEHPIGVCYYVRLGKFQSNCCTHERKKYLGLFIDSHAAHRAWQLCKIEVVKKSTANLVNTRLIAALNRISAKIQSDFDLNLETKSYF